MLQAKLPRPDPRHRVLMKGKALELDRQTHLFSYGEHTGRDHASSPLLSRIDLYFIRETHRRRRAVKMNHTTIYERLESMPNLLFFAHRLSTEPGALIVGDGIDQHLLEGL